MKIDTDFYYPFLGGVEQHVRSLSASLVQRGHEVAVATLGRDGLENFEIDHGVRVYRLQGTAQRGQRLFSHPSRPWAPPIPDPEITRGLWRVLRQERPDVVHGHDWLARSFLPLKPLTSARLVVTLHYYTLSCAKKSLMFGAIPCDGPAPLKCVSCSLSHYGASKGVTTVVGNWLAAAQERRTVDLFLAVSKATAIGNGLTDGTLPAHRVIPNFMPPQSVPEGDLEPYVAQLPTGPYLLFVGDLRREKGLPVLLRAYEGLVSAPPLVLIGKVWDETPSTFPPNVTVLKDWPNYAVLEAWRHSMMAIAPSVWAEPFGIVVIEAMAAGRPVIASRVGGIPDIVMDEETGVLVPPGNPVALRDAIARLIDDPGLMERMGAAGKRRARLFDADQVVPRIEEAYQDVLAFPPPRSPSGDEDYPAPSGTRGSATDMRETG